MARMAFQLHLAGAEAGISAAQCVVALHYSTGTGVALDASRAVFWFRRAAEAGDENAQHQLGECYKSGTGVEADPRLALAWFHRAAGAGHVESQLLVAICNRDGIGTQTDAAQAVAWFRRAAEAGHTEAQHELALCYLNGNGIDADPVQAEAWFRVASNAGFAPSQDFVLPPQHDDFELSYPDLPAPYFTSRKTAWEAVSPRLRTPPASFLAVEDIVAAAAGRHDPAKAYDVFAIVHEVADASTDSSQTLTLVDESLQLMDVYIYSHAGLAVAVGDTICIKYAKAICRGGERALIALHTSIISVNTQQYPERSASLRSAYDAALASVAGGAASS